jgi:hypothetical protein
VAAAGVALTASPAGADPAKPTDYRSEVTSIEPAVDSITLRVVGGDGFLDLVVDDGHEVIVDGYDGEPWLHILRDGTVEENQRSPATYLNNSRYAQVTTPEGVDPTAPPEYEVIGHDGAYTWHDHRIHWMSPQRPEDKQAGDVVFPDWQVELTVDGMPVVVHGQLVWVEKSSPLPWFGLILLVAAVAIVIGRGKSVSVAAVAVVVGAAGALLVGWGERSSLPRGSATTPLVVVLPALALVMGIVALVMRRSPLGVVAVLAGVALVGGWAIYRIRVLLEPVLPTDWPYGLDRFGTALALGLAVGAAVLAVRSGGLGARLPALEFDADAD